MGRYEHGKQAQHECERGFFWHGFTLDPPGWRAIFTHRSIAGTHFATLGSMEAFTPLGFLLRLLAAIVLVLCTFNPSGYSYVHWVASVFPHITPVQAIVGIVLAVGWIVYLTATMRSIGFIGVIIGLAFFGAVVWLIA